MILLGRKWHKVEEANALAIKEGSRGNFQGAADICDLILAKVPDDSLALFNQGFAFQQMGRAGDALASYDKAAALKPDFAEVYMNRSVILRAQYRYDEALGNADKAIAFKPDHPLPYYSRGLILVCQGDMEEAEKMFIRALALNPNFPEAWLLLTRIRKYENPDHADIKSIRTLLANPGIPANNKPPLYFSLGKIYDECGHYDEAFECYREGNLIFKSMVSYDADAVTEMTDRIMEVFTKDFLAQPFPLKSDNRSPLFIVGMPRSGTTLAASILSNHPRIATAGELETINDFTLRLSDMVEDGSPYPEGVKHLTPGIASRFIDDYCKRLKRDAGEDVSFVIDKYPLNFKHLGLIAMLFPGSRIIHCTRHPLDTGLSNYFQQFSLHFAYSFDLGNIGHFYREYARLMEHWKKVLPMQIIDMSYEDMVMDTEKVARRTLDFLGLDWDERCLAPHTNRCAVETASQWQVRQPIYSQSVGRWRFYERYLTPLREKLGGDYEL